MRNLLIIIVLLIFCAGKSVAQESKYDSEMDRIELCKKNYAALFGGEALTGQGTDPEMMDILQKFIFGEIFKTGQLDLKTREMITCISLSAMQTLPQLKAHVGAALNVGVKPVEVRELIYLCAPFIGFPKTLNALATANDVYKDRGITLPLETMGTVTEENRKEKGTAIQQPLYGDEIKNAFKDLPDGMGDELARYLTEYCFGDIYTRDGLDLKTKELLIYALLITIEADSQLRSHTISNLEIGNDLSTLTAVAFQCLPYVGFPSAMKALRIIQEVNMASQANVGHKVRISRIVVDPDKLTEYNDFLKEEIEDSMRLEPGVLTLYATSEKDHPNRITILEIYASEDAYLSHIKTSHFLKYKNGTLDMVKELELLDTTPLIEGMKIK